MAHLAEAEAPTPQHEPQRFRGSVRTWKQARMCSMPVVNLPIEYSTTRRRTADTCIQIIPDRTRAQLNSPTHKDQGHNKDRTFALVTVRVHSEEERGQIKSKSLILSASEQHSLLTWPGTHCPPHVRQPMQVLQRKTTQCAHKSDMRCGATCALAMVRTCQPNSHVAGASSTCRTGNAARGLLTEMKMQRTETTLYVTVTAMRTTLTWSGSALMERGGALGAHRMTVQNTVVPQGTPTHLLLDVPMPTPLDPPTFPITPHHTCKAT